MSDFTPTLLLFAKPAILGRTKTRLHAGLVERFGKEKGDLLTQLLAEAFLTDIAETFKEASFARFVAYTSQPEHPSFQPLRDASFKFIAQSGEDLGERLKDATTQIFNAYKGSPIFIIGSDTPYLGLDTVQNALAAFTSDPALTEKGLDISEKVIIGPAIDGGYYFIAMKRPYLSLFEGISWGSSSVYEETICRAELLNLSVHRLPTLRDIDEIEDLEYLHSESLLRGRTAAVMRDNWSLK